MDRPCSSSMFCHCLLLYWNSSETLFWEQRWHFKLSRHRGGCIWENWSPVHICKSWYLKMLLPTIFQEYAEMHVHQLSYMSQYLKTTIDFFPTGTLSLHEPTVILIVNYRCLTLITSVYEVCSSAKAICSSLVYFFFKKNAAAFSYCISHGRIWEDITFNHWYLMARKIHIALLFIFVPCLRCFLKLFCF